ncbi:hypothetical protein FOXYSP1_20525 [Fusarium oxysporum f. sp. phaseoli]
MSNSAITPLRRAFGWNLVFLAGADSQKFAGVFHPPGSSALTYRVSNAWDDIAFFPAGVQGGYMRTLDTAPPPSGRLISGSSMDTPVVTLPFDPSPQMMSNLSVIRMHSVRYVDCNLNLSEPLGVQIRGGCAQHILIPSVRRDPRSQTAVPARAGTRQTLQVRMRCATIGSQTKTLRVGEIQGTNQLIQTPASCFVDFVDFP